MSGDGASKRAVTDGDDRNHHTAIVSAFKRETDELRDSFVNLTRHLMLMKESLAAAEAPGCDSVDLANNKVPATWRRYLSHLSSSSEHYPLDLWMNELERRVDYFCGAHRYNEDGKFISCNNQPSSSESPSCWLGAFINPRRFLLSLQQDVAMKRQVSLDAMCWEFQVLASDETLPSDVDTADAVWIHGLCLSGARYSNFTFRLIKHSQVGWQWRFSSRPETTGLSMRLAAGDVQSGGRQAKIIKVALCLSPLHHRLPHHQSPLLLHSDRRLEVRCTKPRLLDQKGSCTVFWYEIKQTTASLVF